MYRDVFRLGHSHGLKPSRKDDIVDIKSRLKKETPEQSKGHRPTPVDTDASQSLKAVRSATRKEGQTTDKL